MDWKDVGILSLIVLGFLFSYTILARDEIGQSKIQDLNSSVNSVAFNQYQSFVFDHNAQAAGSLAWIINNRIEVNQQGLQCLQEIQGCQLIQDNNISRLLVCPPKGVEQ